MQISTITGKIPFIGRKKRRQDVFWNLAQEHTRFLYNAAFRYVGNRHDAEDLVHETLYTGYSKFHQLQDDRKFKSWMFRVGEVSDIGQWFTRRLGHSVRMPDLEKLGLKLIGGRKCRLGKIDAALLFCNSKDKRASLFVINQNDLAVPFTKNRKYTIKEGDIKITLWEEFGMIYAMVV